MNETQAVNETRKTQDAQYRLAAKEFGGAIGRLAYAYEHDADIRKDLVQNIHLELWRSFKLFNGRSSIRTWCIVSPIIRGRATCLNKNGEPRGAISI